MTLHRGIAAAVVGAAVLGVWLGYRGLTRRAEVFEAAAQRATAANHILQERARADSVHLDSLLHVAQHRDTLLVHDSTAIVVVDSISRPDSTCGPSLAARDRLIADQKSQLGTLREALAAVTDARNAYHAAADSLQRALDLRPRRFSRFLGPNIGLGVSIGVDPVSTLAGKPLALRVSAGLTLNLGGLHL